MASKCNKYLVREKGGPLVPTLAAKPVSIEPTEVMISLKVIAINPADIKMIDQGHRVTSWPLVAGLDGAGVIEAVGDKVKDFAVGDEVLAMFASGDRGGSFQEVAVIQETMVAKKPATWSFEDAATLAVCYLSGVVALGVGVKTHLPFLKDGPTTGFKPTSVLILGGSSAVGAATIQLLRLAVPDCTILATGSRKHHDHIIALGANKAIDRNSTSLVIDVKCETPDFRGVDAIIDAVGAGSTQREVFESLGPIGPKKYAQIWTGADEINVPSGVNSVMFRVSELTQLQGGRNAMRALETLLEEGRYRLPLPARKVGDGVDALARGLELMRRGVSGEKLVVGLDGQSVS